MSRSLSIVLLTIVQAAMGLLSLTSGIFLLLLVTGTVEVFNQDLQGLSLSLKVLIALGVAISLFGLVVTYGFWRLQSWGWTGSILFQVLCIANNGLASLVGQEISRSALFSVAFSATLIAAFYLPSVRDVFEPLTRSASDG
ncbi:MAG: hypothetical protein ACFBSG_09390 [Leptolyngbyaceae cyanobacterium]